MEDLKKVISKDLEQYKMELLIAHRQEKGEMAIRKLVTQINTLVKYTGQTEVNIERIADTLRVYPSLMK